MTHIAAHLLVGSTLALLTACAGKPPATVLVEDDSACPLTLHTGQTLILNLPSNPASGYRWQVQAAAPQVLKPLGPEVFRSAEGGVIGGDGVSTWRFEVAQPGEARLQLRYSHAWETGIEPAAAFDCRLQVR